MNRGPKDVIEGLLDYVHEWTFEDTGNGENNFCEECGATYRIGTQPKLHKPGCKLKSLLEDAQLMLDEWARIQKVSNDFMASLPPCEDEEDEVISALEEDLVEDEVVSSLEEDLVYFRQKLCAALGVDEKALSDIPDDPLKYDREAAEKVLQRLCHERGYRLARVSLVLQRFTLLNEAMQKFLERNKEAIGEGDQG